MSKVRGIKKIKICAKHMSLVKNNFLIENIYPIIQTSLNSGVINHYFIIVWLLSNHITHWFLFSSTLITILFQVIFRAGHVEERMGLDQQTQYACCEFRKMNGGFMRDDFTEVCCKSIVNGNALKIHWFHSLT